MLIRLVLKLFNRMCSLIRDLRASCRANCRDASVVLAGEGNTLTLSAPAAGGRSASPKSGAESGAVSAKEDGNCDVSGGASNLITTCPDSGNAVQSSGGNPIPQTLPETSNSSAT